MPSTARWRCLPRRHLEGLRVRSFRSPCLTRNPLPGYAAPPETEVMLGFVRTDNEALVWCLGDPQRAVAAYHELLRRGQDAMGASRDLVAEVR